MKSNDLCELDTIVHHLNCKINQQVFEMLLRNLNQIAAEERVFAAIAESQYVNILLITPGLFEHTKVIWLEVVESKVPWQLAVGG